MDSALDRSVFRWVILASAAASFLIGLVSFAALRSQALEIANQEIEVASSRAEALTRFVPGTILSRAKDWAAWEDTTFYLEGKRPAFPSYNLTPELLQTIEVDDIIILNSAGQINASYLMGADPAEQAAWRKMTRLPTFSRGSMSSRGPQTGFVLISGKLHVVAAAPVVPMPGGGTARGVIMMGRQITDRELSEVLQMPVKIKAGVERKHSSEGGTAMVHVPLPAFTGTQGATLELTVPLNATKSARLTQIVLPMALIALTLMGSALVFLVVNRLVTRRVTNLDRELRELTDLQSVQRLPDDSSDDEIASLRVSINSLIDHVEAMNADERRLRKQALFALNDARRAEKAKSNFIAITSHEVRNPLAAVVGGIDVLLAQKLPAPIAPIVARLESSANRLKEIVNDVLDYSRIEQGSVPLQLEPVDLVVLVGSLVESSQSLAKAKNITLLFASEVSAAHVNADRFRIEQVLSNLIDNAIKFTHQGQISVRLALIGAGRWRFEVEDTGIGVNPAVAGKLFDPYFQADQSTVRRNGGTGLGLAICRRIVTAMGGRIWLESKPGMGSAFFVELPLESPESAPPAVKVKKPASAALRSHIQPLSLLLVEDNDLVQAMLLDHVATLGHRAEAVSNGLAALNAVAGSTYDAILMDMHMPVMDGITASHAIRALGGERAEVPIIAITADAAASRRQLYEGNDFQAFLIKPADSATLQNVLSAIKPRRPGKRAPSSQSVTPLIAPEKILELEHTMGLPKLAKHLGAFSRDLSSAGGNLVELCRKGDLRSASEAAHKLQGSALQLGAIQLQGLLASVQALEAGSDVTPVIDALTVTLPDTLVAVNGLLDSMSENLSPSATQSL